MADLEAETDRLRFQFLSVELRLSLTFTQVARVEFDSGDREHGQQALGRANRGYETITSFLADPKHCRRLTGPQLDTLKESLRKLRDAIDGVQAPA